MSLAALYLTFIGVVFVVNPAQPSSNRAVENVWANSKQDKDTRLIRQMGVVKQSFFGSGGIMTMKRRARTQPNTEPGISICDI